MDLQCKAEFVSSQGDVHCKACVPSEHRLIEVEHTLLHPTDETKCLLHFASPVMSYLEKYPGLLMFENAKHIKELPKTGDRICLNKGVVQGVMAHHLIGAKRKKAGADAEDEDKRKMGDQSRVKKLDPFEMIPDELLLNIFANLDYKSAVQASATSKRFRALATDRAVYDKLSQLPWDVVNIDSLAKRAYLHDAFDVVARNLDDSSGLAWTFYQMPVEFFGPYEKFEAAMNAKMRGGHPLYADLSTGHNDVPIAEQHEETWDPDNGTPLRQWSVITSDGTDGYLRKESDGTISVYSIATKQLLFTTLLTLMHGWMAIDNDIMFEYCIKYFLSRPELDQPGLAIRNLFRAQIVFELFRTGAEKCFKKLLSLVELDKRLMSVLLVDDMVIQWRDENKRTKGLDIVKTLAENDILDVRAPSSVVVKLANIPTPFQFAVNDSACLVFALANRSLELFTWFVEKTAVAFDDTQFGEEFDSPLLFFLLLKIIDGIMSTYTVMGKSEYVRDTYQDALRLVAPKMKPSAIKNTLSSARFSIFIYTLRQRIPPQDSSAKPKAAKAIRQQIVAPLVSRIPDLRLISEEHNLDTTLSLLVLS